MNISGDYRTLGFVIFLVVVCLGIVIFFEAIIASLHLMSVTHAQPYVQRSPVP